MKELAIALFLLLTPICALAAPKANIERIYIYDGRFRLSLEDIRYIRNSTPASLYKNTVIFERKTVRGKVITTKVFCGKITK